MDQSYYTPPAAAPQQQNNTMAIISLIASILGLTFIPTIGSIVGLILGYMARRQIRESGGAMGGEGMAKAGIIIGWIGVGLAVLGICIVIAVVALGLTIPGIGICASLGNVNTSY
jgi:uncharacterized Tic20 family protein